MEDKENQWWCSSICKSSKICQKCKPVCKGEFSKAIDLKSAGISVYVHHGDNESDDQKKKTKRNSDTYLLYNESCVPLDKSKYIEEMKKINAQCAQCNNILSEMKGLLDKAQTVNQKEVIGVCDHCKLYSSRVKCKRCAAVINKFISKLMSDYEETQKHFKGYITDMKQMIGNILEKQTVSKKLEDTSTIKLKTLLREFRRPTTKHGPNILDFPAADMDTRESLDENKALLKKIMTVLESESPTMKENLETLLGTEYMKTLPEELLVTLGTLSKEKLVKLLGLKLTNEVIDQLLANLGKLTIEKLDKVLGTALTQDMMDMLLLNISILNKEKAEKAFGLDITRNIIDHVLAEVGGPQLTKDKLRKIFSSDLPQQVITEILTKFNNQKLTIRALEKVLGPTVAIHSLFDKALRNIGKLTTEKMEKIIGKDLCKDVVNKLITNIGKLSQNKLDHYFGSPITDRIVRNILSNLTDDITREPLETIIGVELNDQVLDKILSNLGKEKMSRGALEKYLGPSIAKDVLNIILGRLSPKTMTQENFSNLLGPNITKGTLDKIYASIINKNLSVKILDNLLGLGIATNVVDKILSKIGKEKLVLDKATGSDESLPPLVSALKGSRKLEASKLKRKSDQASFTLLPSTDAEGKSLLQPRNVIFLQSQKLADNEGNKFGVEKETQTEKAAFIKFALKTTERPTDNAKEFVMSKPVEEKQSDEDILHKKKRLREEALFREKSIKKDADTKKEVNKEVLKEDKPPKRSKLELKAVHKKEDKSQQDDKSKKKVDSVKDDESQKSSKTRKIEEQKEDKLQIGKKNKKNLESEKDDESQKSSKSEKGDKLQKKNESTMGSLPKIKKTDTYIKDKPIKELVSQKSSALEKDEDKESHKAVKPTREEKDKIRSESGSMQSKQVQVNKKGGSAEGSDTEKENSLKKQKSVHIIESYSGKISKSHREPKIQDTMINAKQHKFQKQSKELLSRSEKKFLDSTEFKPSRKQIADDLLRSTSKKILIPSDPDISKELAISRMGVSEPGKHVVDLIQTKKEDVFDLQDVMEETKPEPPDMKEKNKSGIFYIQAGDSEKKTNVIKSGKEKTKNKKKRKDQAKVTLNEPHKHKPKKKEDTELDDLEKDKPNESDRDVKKPKSLKISASTKELLKQLKSREAERKEREKARLKEQKVVRKIAIPKIDDLPELPKQNKEVDSDVTSIIDECKYEPKYENDMVKGNSIAHLRRHKDVEPASVKPLLFKMEYKAQSPLIKKKHITTIVDPKATMSKIYQFMETEELKGIIRYDLSNPEFIDKGWTKLPTMKIMKRLNIYRMVPANPCGDWFLKHKLDNILFYDTGEKLAEIDPDGYGRWYYRNGIVALDFYKAEEANVTSRYVIYSSGENDDYGRLRLITVLACFDQLGNGIVYDHCGNTRLKYNQTEGVVIDEKIGAPGKWKWHSLNDPIVLKPAYMDNYPTSRYTKLEKLIERAEKSEIEISMSERNFMQRNKSMLMSLQEEKIAQMHANEQMLAIELGNQVKQKTQKLLQRFKPFEIKPKFFRINENFSLKIITQSNIGLEFRSGQTVLKQNLGMVLIDTEIVDTESVDITEVATPLDRVLPRTQSVEHLVRLIRFARAKNKGCQ